MIHTKPTESLPKGAPTTDRIVTLTMIAVVLFFAGFRIFRGVDYLDEAYYNAVPYRFVLGDSPFVDQRGAHLGLHQTAFLLFTPLVCLFHWVTGGTQGIVLFLRTMFLVFNISIAVVVYRVLRCTVDRNIALLASLFCIAFSSEWVTFCYNNLGALFLLVTLMLEFRAVTTDGPRVPVLMGLAGLSSGLAVVSYPTMALPVAVSVAASLAYVTTERVRVFVAFVIGFFLGTAPVAAVALNVGWANLVSFAASSANVSGEVGQGGGGQKLVGILKGLWRICFPDQRAQVGVLIMVGLVVLFRRRQKLFLAALASIVFLPLMGSRFGAWGTSFAYLIKFCLWCPLLFFLLRNKWPFAGRLYWCVALPSLVAGFTTAWTSANGAINAGVGLVPATIVTILLLSLVVENAFSSYKVLARFSSMAVLCSLLFVVIFFQFKFIYGEGIPNDLTARVDNGPYWGIETTETKAALSRSLSQDVHKYGAPGRVLFYDVFPAGYLFEANRPASNTTWEYRGARSDLIAYIKDPNHRPGTVFEMKALFNHRGCTQFLNYSPDDPLVAYVRCHYKMVCETVFYRIYAERQAPAEPDGEMFETRGAQATTLSQAEAR